MDLKSKVRFAERLIFWSSFFTGQNIAFFGQEQCFYHEWFPTGNNCVEKIPVRYLML
jgi:hypothetical protein